GFDAPGIDTPGVNAPGIDAAADLRRGAAGVCRAASACYAPATAREPSRRCKSAARERVRGGCRLRRRATRTPIQETRRADGSDGWNPFTRGTAYSRGA